MIGNKNTKEDMESIKPQDRRICGRLKRTWMNEIKLITFKKGF